MGSARDATADFWDQVLRDWSPGRESVRNGLDKWADSYLGATGRGAVDFDAIPEPYIGRMRSSDAGPAMVFLGLNPGGAVDEQRPGGRFVEAIGDSSFSEWAASSPYASEQWIAEHGRNRYQQQRLRFARHMTGRDDLEVGDLLILELYPWHSSGVTQPMAAPPDMLEQHVWAPLAEIGTEFIFAFGAPWERMASQLRLKRGRPLNVRWSVASRRVTSYELSNDQQLIVSVHSGSAGPPAAPDTEKLRKALSTS